MIATISAKAVAMGFFQGKARSLFLGEVTAIIWNWIYHPLFGARRSRCSSGWPIVCSSLAMIGLPSFNRDVRSGC
jgi:hypothetical protein